MSDTLTESEKVQLAAILQEAAGDIAEFGWKNEGAAEWPQDYDPYGEYPRCVYIAVSRRISRNIHFAKFKYTNALDEAIFHASGTSSLNELFQLNDSQPQEEGQAWAFGVLITASHILNPALARGENKTDIDSTKTDTGSTTNVVTRVLRYLKRFTWVR